MQYLVQRWRRPYRMFFFLFRRTKKLTVHPRTRAPYNALTRRPSLVERFGGDWFDYW